MARKDHYVSQTYLRLFVGPSGDLVPYYKNARVIIGKSKKPKSICFETEGDTNKYFENPRILEKFLPAFENPWKNNIAKLERRVLDKKTKYELAGYIAFLRSCSQTAKRLGQQMIAGTVEPVAYKVMLSTTDKANYLSVEDKHILRDAILKRKIGINIDREFAHAQAMRALERAIHRYYCSRWLVLINKTDIPFITSDNPAILYYRDIQQQIAQTYVSLNPSMALLITPDIDMDNPSIEDVEKYSNSEDGFGIIKQSYVNKFNEAIVKSAERMVLHQKKEDWLEQLVRKYSKWRVDAIVTNLSSDRETITIARIIARQPPDERTEE
jgi:hypothetical protein